MQNTSALVPASPTNDRRTQDESGTAPEDRKFRPDVQGLRAVAVLLVVLFHAGSSARERWLCRRRRVLRHLGVRDHRGAAPRAGVDGPDIDSGLLRSALPADHPGRHVGHRRHHRRRPMHSSVSCPVEGPPSTVDGPPFSSSTFISRPKAPTTSPPSNSRRRSRTSGRSRSKSSSTSSIPRSSCSWPPSAPECPCGSDWRSCWSSSSVASFTLGGPNGVQSDGGLLLAVHPSLGAGSRRHSSPSARHGSCGPTACWRPP